MADMMLWWYWEPFNFHPSFNSNKRGMSFFFFSFVFFLSPVTGHSHLPDGHGVALGLRATSCPTTRSPHPEPSRAILCGNLDDHQTPQNILYPSEHIKHGPFVSLWGYSSGSSAGATQRGAFRCSHTVAGPAPSLV